jgi:hypothetical protein
MLSSLCMVSKVFQLLEVGLLWWDCHCGFVTVELVSFVYKQSNLTVYNVHRQISKTIYPVSFVDFLWWWYFMYIR